MTRKGSLPVLGRFPGSKLTVLAGSLVSLGLISGMLALQRHSTVAEVPAAAEPAPAPAPDVQQAPQVIRRIYVIRRRSPEIISVPQPAPQAPAPQAQTAPARRPTPKPVTKSRGS